MYGFVIISDGRCWFEIFVRNTFAVGPINGWLLALVSSLVDEFVVDGAFRDGGRKARRRRKTAVICHVRVIFILQL